MAQTYTQNDYVFLTGNQEAALALSDLSAIGAQLSRLAIQLRVSYVRGSETDFDNNPQTADIRSDDLGIELVDGADNIGRNFTYWNLPNPLLVIRNKNTVAEYGQIYFLITANASWGGFQNALWSWHYHTGLFRAYDDAGNVVSQTSPYERTVHAGTTNFATKYGFLINSCDNSKTHWQEGEAAHAAWESQDIYLENNNSYADDWVDNEDGTEKIFNLNWNVSENTGTTPITLKMTDSSYNTKHSFVTNLTITPPVTTNLSYCKNGVWVPCKGYYGANGQWVPIQASYGTSNQWKS